MTTIVTGFSPSGYSAYGAQFLLTFDRYWPREVGLRYFVEELTPAPCVRGGERRLSTCNGAMEFIARHKDSPRANGREPIPGAWAPKHIANGYHFKFDAVKFSRQCFIPERAADDLEDGEVMAWSDADVVAFKEIPSGFVEGLLGDHDVCYLGRNGTHTELGFWAVRLNPRTRDFLAAVAAMYRTDGVFALREWHSAYVWDTVRKCHEAAGLKSLNMTPNGRGHVWFQSPLGRYTDHLKGTARKAAGRSLERVG